MYVGVIGSESYEPWSYQMAYEVGRLVALRGGIVVCGGLGGVMEGASRGCKEAGGVSIGILPGNQRRWESLPHLFHTYRTWRNEKRARRSGK